MKYIQVETRTTDRFVLAVPDELPTDEFSVQDYIDDGEYFVEENFGDREVQRVVHLSAEARKQMGLKR
jgi:hypothetical protein